MTIKQQQAQLLSAIFSLADAKTIVASDAITSEQGNALSPGLKVYQNSLLANAKRALAITFATVHSFVGEIVFAQLVKIYLQKCLKAQYDWGELGREFPTIIKHQSLENNAVLASIAELDFICHQAERAEDVARDLSSLSLLNNLDAYQLKINFAAGFTLLELNYPADLLIAGVKCAHKSNSKLTLTDIAQRLVSVAAGEYYYYLIWRPNFQAQYQQVTQQEYQWLALWQSSQTLPNSQQLSIGHALDKMSNDKFSIIEWLPKAVEQQLINSMSTLTAS